MFSVSQSTFNNSGTDINLSAYGRVNRSLQQNPQSNYILHEGLIGVFDGILQEVSYDDIKENCLLWLEEHPIVNVIISSVGHPDIVKKDWFLNYNLIYLDHTTKVPFTNKYKRL